MKILLEAEQEKRFLDEALGPYLDQFEPRDRRFLQEITFGTIRHRNTLDHVLSAYVKLPPAKQKAPQRWALRLGAYQLIYLERVPAHAALNQTLDGLKAIGGVHRRDIGFVNAILHKLSNDIQRKDSRPPLDDADPAVLPIRSGYCRFCRPVLPLIRLDAVRHFALKYSHPTWLVGRWRERFGEEELAELLRASDRVPTLTARVTQKAPSREELVAKLRKEGFEAEPASRDDAVTISRGGDISTSAVFASGWLQVQDTTAMHIGSLLAPPKNARVLDLCSAPGGKASQLLECVGPGGHVVAADRSDEKLQLVQGNLSRIDNHFSTLKLPDKPEEIDLGEKFSHILVDAPCSNTGVLARRTDARWRLKVRDIARLAKLQASLLEAAYRHLAPGGRIVYATCSIEPEENEEQVAALIEAHPELSELDVKLFLPHRTEGDGGYCSLILKPAT